MRCHLDDDDHRDDNDATACMCMRQRKREGLLHSFKCTILHFFTELVRKTLPTKIKPLQNEHLNYIFVPTPNYFVDKVFIKIATVLISILPFLTLTITKT